MRRTGSCSSATTVLTDAAHWTGPTMRIYWKCVLLFLAAVSQVQGSAQNAGATGQAAVVPAPAGAITLDEYLNTTDITAARISPDGSAAVIGTSSPDWAHDRFRKSLWLWRRGGGAAVVLTSSGNDTEPQWSPDGRYIAFVSDRPVSGGAKATDDGEKTEKTGRVWVLPMAGGEAFPLYRESLDVHAFAWAPSSDRVMFAVMEPRSKDAEEAYKKEWKDTVQWRDKDRGDTLLSLPIAAAIQTNGAVPQAHDEPKIPADKPEYPKAAKVITHIPLAMQEFVVSPDGMQIAFETGPVAHRLESPADTELYVVAAAGGDPRRLTHNEGSEGRLAWAPAGKTIYVLVRAAGGSIEGPYQDVQGRVYAVDAASGATVRLGSRFDGSWEDLTVSHDGTVFAVGLKGMNQSIYRLQGDGFAAVSDRPGAYGRLGVADRGGAILFTHSGITEPTQVYVAAGAGKLKDAEAITALNAVFAARAKPEWRPFTWEGEDGTPVEGVLIYPPGKKNEKHLRMLTLIHGGPADADGDRFGANWYDWAGIAAARGWLVFRPNYRGSTGYGDAFQLGIRPHLVSAPGKDILAGVDALVNEGIADPDHLAIGGYSYGGYMTNWILTQTTRFKAAMTGAGAVEHAANWGFDDLTFDDAWYLSGAPWEKPDLYESEAALFHMDKVKTPTHMVGGDADNRVSFFEQIVFERALERLQVPHALLQFPGENHPLGNNPWHGYIKLREELKWLDKYAAN